MQTLPPCPPSRRRCLAWGYFDPTTSPQFAPRANPYVDLGPQVIPRLIPQNPYVDYGPRRVPPIVGPNVPPPPGPSTSAGGGVKKKPVKAQKTPSKKDEAQQLLKKLLTAKRHVK